MRSLICRGDEAGSNRVLGARTDAAKNERDRQHSDARACAEQQISTRRGSGAGCECSCPADPLRRTGDRNRKPAITPAYSARNMPTAA